MECVGVWQDQQDVIGACGLPCLTLLPVHFPSLPFAVQQSSVGVFFYLFPLHFCVFGGGCGVFLFLQCFFFLSPFFAEL